MKALTIAKSAWLLRRSISWFKPATIILSLLLFQNGGVAIAQEVYTLDVPSTVPWTDTGINIAAGSQLIITATGTVHYSYSSYQVCDANGGDYSGAQFLSDVMLPNTVCHSLVGKIGGTTAVGDGTPVPEGTPGDGPGFVGTSYSEVIPTGGELFLGFNDNPAVFWDNSGSFSVTVTVVPAFSARDTYKALVAAVAISTNQAGNLTYCAFGNEDLIRECAAETGITNLTGLHLVYDLKTDTLDVVHGTGTNETLVCTPLTFSGGVFLNNTNSDQSERLAWVYWGSNKVASGTLTATERYEYGASNQLVGFSLRGQLQFALPGIGTNAPTIYHGSLVAGSKLFGPFDPLPPFSHFGSPDFGRHGD